MKALEGIGLWGKGRGESQMEAQCKQRHRFETALGKMLRELVVERVQARL